MILLEVLMPIGRKQGRIMMEYKMPSAFIIGKVIQSKGAWIFKDFRICVRKVDWIVQTLVEYSKPA
jgi:hypothetical protein